MITAIGGVLVPLCLIFFNRPWKLLALIFFYSVFSAAAIFVVGGAGVTPALLPASLFTLTFIVAMLTGTRYPGQRRALILLTPFILVIAGAVLSSIVMPRLFYGEVYVWPQKMTIFARSPLAPNAGNYTQDMYLVSDALLTITAAIYLTRPGANFSRLLDCYLYASFVAVGISLWQFLSNTVHIPFPSTFFLSNPGWDLMSLETVGSMIRLNGPFSEPSSLAAWLSAVVCASGWLVLHGDKRLMPRIALGLSFGVVLLSTATTGFATLGIMGGFLVLRSIAGGSPQFRQRVFAAIIGAMVLGSIVTVATPVIAPGVAKEAALVFSSTLNKNQSSSYQDRTAADHDAVIEMLQTFGLGVGWGSDRSSSLLPGLCAGIGLWGIAGFVWFGLMLAAQLKKLGRRTPDPAYRRVVGAAGVAVLSTLVSGAVSEPTISSPDFFLLVGMLVAAAASAPQQAVSSVRQPRYTLKVVSEG
jgi:hypothetical protein